MLVKFALVSLLSIFAYLHHAEGVCTYAMDGPNYTCFVIDQVINNVADQWVTGTHLPGLGIDNVVAFVSNASSNSVITLFPHSAIGYFVNMRTIVLDSVQMQFFGNQLQPGRCNSLTTVRIINNPTLQAMGGSMFVHCNSLTHVDLSNNQIHTINENAFSNAPIWNVNLAYNNLTFLDRAFLSNMPYLTTLRADHNQIDRLAANLFVGIPMNELHLNDNRIPAFFQNIPTLSVLQLANNEITSLNFGIGNLTQLQVLNLSRNNISTIYNHVFQNYTLLSNLDLSHNNLEFLEENSIRPILQMRILDVSNNGIERIDREMFEDAFNLLFVSHGNVCFNGSTTIVNNNDFNGRAANLLAECFSFATTVKVNIAILLASVLASLIWRM